MLLSRVLRKLKFFYFNSELLRNPLLFSLLIHWILASTFLTLFSDILKMFSSLPSFLKNFLNLFNVPSIVLGEGIIELHLLWCSWSRKEPEGSNTVGTCHILDLQCVVPFTSRPHGSPTLQVRKHVAEKSRDLPFMWNMNRQVTEIQMDDSHMGKHIQPY